jgi:hypothetical protein
MRASVIACTLTLALACGGAQAQSSTVSKGAKWAEAKATAPKSAQKEEVADLRGRMEAWYEDCRKGWDAKTHMTKRDYDRTCRRMAQERIKFLDDEAKGIIRLKQY